MKKVKLLSVLLFTFILAACTTPGNNTPSEDTGGNNDPQIPSFVPNENDSGSKALQELAKRENGFEIAIEVKSTVDGEVEDAINIEISQLDNLRWATMELAIEDEKIEGPIKVGFAEEYEEEFTNYYYLNLETEKYEYFGQIKSLDYEFDIAFIESLLTLDTRFMGALLISGAEAKIETIAGEKCATFVVDGEYFGEYIEGSKFVISYSLESRLMMKLELMYTENDENGIPVFYQDTINVKSINDAGEKPTLVGKE